MSSVAFGGHWTVREVAALRKAMRCGPYAFATFIGVTPKSVLAWEDGTTVRIRASSQELLDQALKRAGPDVRARFERNLSAPNDDHVALDNASILAGASIFDSRSSCVQTWEVDDTVNRRGFATAMAGLPLAAADCPAQADLTTRGGAVIGASEVGDLIAAVDRYGNQDQAIGGATLVDSAQRQLRRATWILETCDFHPEAAELFTSAVGNLAVQAGWLAFDAEQHGLARQNYHEAIALAGIAGDDALMVHACLNAAMQAINLSRRHDEHGRPRGSARYALRLITRARNLTHGMPSGRVHCLVAMREAIALAALGDESGFRRALASAHREMDRAAEYEPLTGCPRWLRFISHAEVRLHEAIGLTFLGQDGNGRGLLDAAVELFAQTAHYDSGPRNTVAYHAGYAAALARAGDIIGARQHGNMVLTHLEGPICSPRTLRMLGDVRTAGTAKGDDFNDRFDELARRTGVSV